MGNEHTTAALQELTSRQVAGRHIKNMVLAVQSGDREIDAVAAAGFSDPAGETPMRPDTPYLLASISKMYTATAIMTLYGSGEISLDEPAATYLGPELLTGMHVIDGTDYGSTVTVRHLLDQTSGLADYFSGAPKGGSSLEDELKEGNDRQLSVEDIAEIVRRLEPEFPPGGKGNEAHYSDTNYALLGAIIVAVTGTNLDDVFARTIYAPLGLTATYAVDHARNQPRPAKAFFKDQPVLVPRFLTGHTAEGGLVATADESIRFLRGFFDGTLLAESQLALMTNRFNPAFFPIRYGYGIMEFRLPGLMRLLGGPPVLVGHSGSTGSFAFYDRKRDLYLAGTVNQMDNPARPFRLIARAIRVVD